MSMAFECEHISVVLPPKSIAISSLVFFPHHVVYYELESRACALPVTFDTNTNVVTLNVWHGRNDFRIFLVTSHGDTCTENRTNREKLLKLSPWVYNSSASLKRLIWARTEAPLVVAKVQAPPAMVMLQFLTSHLKRMRISKSFW